ncbi:MAG: hypothetical protein UZ22_OP11002000476 [Microgenomates bacterium OLB23]|nr:MAG: hypothetical protein UZ22_OP11002000476 [Microgenomates bacterium OLB23]
MDTLSYCRICWFVSKNTLDGSTFKDNMVAIFEFFRQSLFVSQTLVTIAVLAGLIGLVFAATLAAQKKKKNQLVLLHILFVGQA